MTEAREPSVRPRPLSGSPAPERGISPLLDLLPHFFETLKREPALAISLTYLLVAMAGIFYDVAFYKKFAIPVLSLAQLGDFLTAGIQQPIALVLVASTFPICWLFDRINMRHRRRQRVEIERLKLVDAPRPYERLRLRYLGWRVGQIWEQRLAYLAVIVAYGWLFVGFYADYRADAAKQGLWDRVNANKEKFTDPTILNAIKKYKALVDEGLFNKNITSATFVVSLAVMYAVNAMGVLRVSAEGEQYGLDLHEHGISAYPEYVISAAGSPSGAPAAATPAKAPSPAPAVAFTQVVG